MSHETSNELKSDKKQSEDRTEWYYNWWVIGIALFVFGPLGLLPLWFKPKTNINLKIFITLVVILMTVFMTKSTVDYYRIMMDHQNEIQKSIENI